MFKIGDIVVKPNTGICRIEDITIMSLMGSEKKEYYVLAPVEDDRSKLYVTTEADRTRLRALMTSEEAHELLSHIEDIEAVWVKNDKLREKEYKEAFKTNEPEKLVAIIKSLYNRSRIRLAQGKKITSTDEKFFKQAEKALYSELAFSLNIEVDEIETVITETIEK